MTPTTHRVHPQAADGWACDNAKPPGDGFEEIERPLSLRELLLLVLVGWAMWGLLIDGIHWLFVEIAAGRIR